MMAFVDRLERLHVPARGRLRQFIIRTRIRRDVVRPICGHAFRLLLKRASRTFFEEWGGAVSTGFQEPLRCFGACDATLFSAVALLLNNFARRLRGSRIASSRLR